jgi:hypothetical protein
VEGLVELEQLLWGLYGPDHQIDVGARLARAHLFEPCALDLARLAYRVDRTGMMRVAGIVVVAEASIEDGRVRLLATGQTFRRGPRAPARLPPGRYRLRVVDWEDPRRVALVPEGPFTQ